VLTLKFKPESVSELATHVIPEFSPLTLLLRSNAACFNGTAVGDTLVLELKWPGAFKESVLNVTVVLRFEVEELKDWVLVKIPPSQQALIHHVRYLCRHHINEYGKLFHQLVNDFCHSYQR